MADKYLKVPLELAQDLGNYITENPCPGMAVKVPLKLLTMLRSCEQVTVVEDEHENPVEDTSGSTPTPDEEPDE